MTPRPSYSAVFLLFLRNSLVRELTFRANFIIECFSSVTWTLMNLGYYLLVFQFTQNFGDGWGRWEFFVFLGTTMIINSIVQAFFMPNCEEVSELIRTGGLDFVLLKPIDTQFVVSLQKVDWSALANFAAGVILLAVSLGRINHPIPWGVLMVTYPLFILCGVAILYSLMIALASAGIWLGRNQSLYDFWFYITNFSRYPMEIYEGSVGTPLRILFTYLLPVLLVVNVPARLLARPLYPQESVDFALAAFTVVAALGCLIASRMLFLTALKQYRSASS